MIVTLCGEAGSGKSTCARGISEKLSLKHYSSGDLMRQMAEERGFSLSEFSKMAEKDPSIDKALDDRQISLGKNEDAFIIDGRLSAYFIPHAIKVFLTADVYERARRIHNANRSTENSASLDEAVEMVIARQESEIKRYKKWYNYNPYDPASYDIVYDSTNIEISKMIEDICSKITTLAE